MRIEKKLVVILITLTLVNSLSACGRNNTDSVLDSEKITQNIDNDTNDNKELSTDKEESAEEIEPVGFILDNGHFSGNAWAEFMDIPSQYNLPMIGLVTFEPGCRNDWHVHDGGQILIVTGGEGYYQEEGKPVRLLHEGDVVEIGANVKHWHGATPESWFAHIAIETNPQMGSSSWIEKVSDGEYQNLKVENSEGEDTYPIGNQMTDERVSGNGWIKEIEAEDFFNLPVISYETLGAASQRKANSEMESRIVIITGGKGYRVVDGKEQGSIQTGDLLILSADAGETYKADENSELSCIVITMPL